MKLMDWIVRRMARSQLSEAVRLDQEARAMLVRSGELRERALQTLEIQDFLESRQT